MSSSIAAPGFPLMPTMPLVSPIPAEDNIPRMDVEDDEKATPEMLVDGWSGVLLIGPIDRYEGKRFSHIAFNFCFLKDIADLTEELYNQAVKSGRIGRLFVAEQKVKHMFFGRIGVNCLNKFEAKEFILISGKKNLAFDHILPKPIAPSADDPQVKLFDQKYNLVCAQMLAGLKEKKIIL